MQETSFSVSDSRRSANRIVAFGLAAIVGILATAGGVLLLTLPDANAFNLRVERLFIDKSHLIKKVRVPNNGSIVQDIRHGRHAATSLSSHFSC